MSSPHSPTYHTHSSLLLWRWELPSPSWAMGVGLVIDSWMPALGVLLLLLNSWSSPIRFLQSKIPQNRELLCLLLAHVPTAWNMSAMSRVLNQYLLKWMGELTYWLSEWMDGYVAQSENFPRTFLIASVWGVSLFIRHQVAGKVAQSLWWPYPHAQIRWRDVDGVQGEKLCWVMSPAAPRFSNTPFLTSNMSQKVPLLDK